MKYARKYIWWAVIAIAATIGLAACSQEDVVAPDGGGAELVGDKIVITGSILVPDMPQTVTRGNAGATPNENLKLTLLEFTKGSDGSNSFLTNIYQAETTTTTAVANEGIVHFKVTLNNTTEARKLHLMVADQFINCDFGSEADLLPSITVSESNGRPQEAYWGCVEFDNGYSDIDADGTATLKPEVATKLTNVPMIRNFARVTLTSNAANFQVEGFQLVNVPTTGTIAPWNASSLGTPQLLNGSAMKSYPDIDAAGYKGVVPANAGFRNQESEVKTQDGTGWGMAEQYIYEHPYESSRHTYMIVKGRYNNLASSYYMIDIGNIDSNNHNQFSFLNLVRNISYDVTINEVLTTGASTPSQAINGLVYNNISASVQTSAMPNVSDGKNLLVVNSTSIVFVNDQPVEFMYRYHEGVDVNNPTTDATNAKVTVVGLQERDVVASYTTESRTIDGNRWVVIKITPKTPTDVTRQQSFTVIDNNGLGRTIRLTSHVPWNISRLLYSNTATVDYDLTASSTSIGNAQGATMTLFIDLPDGLPESIFPLEFTVEDSAQQLENNPVGNMRVTSGPSLADPTKVAIQYIKPITYQDYLYRLNGSAVDVSLSNTGHRIPCRMLTILAGTTGGTSYVNNPYFNIHTIEYTRR